MWLTKAWVDVFGLQAAVDVLEKDFMRTVTRMGLKFHRDQLGSMVAQTGLADAQVSCHPLIRRKKESEVELLLQVEGMFEDDKPVIMEMLAQESQWSALVGLFAFRIRDCLHCGLGLEVRLYKRDSVNSIAGHYALLLVQDLDYVTDEQDNKHAKELVSLEEAIGRLQNLLIDLYGDQENLADEKKAKPRP